MTLADKIVVLQAGRVEQVSSPLELYDNPDNRFVAGFIGSPKMNFLDATVASVEVNTVRVAIEGDPASTVPFTLNKSRPEIGAGVTLGIRPEHLDFTGATGVPLRLAGDVTEQMGEISYVHAYTKAGTHVVAEARGMRFEAEPGEITIGVNPAKAFLFDNVGMRLR